MPASRARPPEHARALRAAAPKHLHGQVAGRPHGAVLPEAEHGHCGPGDAPRRAPGARRGPRTVAHEVDGAVSIAHQHRYRTARGTRPNQARGVLATISVEEPKKAEVTTMLA